MGQNFVKLFSSITESTVWCEADRTRLVWITLLAMADSQGCIWGSIPGLANRARVPVEDCRMALDTFLSPDRDSRNPAQEGRRIEVIAGGWRLINYTAYRMLKNTEARQASKREYMRRWRLAQRQVNIIADHVEITEKPTKDPNDEKSTLQDRQGATQRNPAIP